MRIVGRYSFNSGKEIIESKYPAELIEIEQVLAAVDGAAHKTKTSQEKTMLGRALYSPISLNRAVTTEFQAHHWTKHRVYCDYSTNYYDPDYIPSQATAQKRQRPFREMDFVRNGVGVEVQFGKYAFMVYNVCAKMTIFHKMGVIEVGVEIVPVKDFADEMSTGVSYFEQFVWDLEHRGVADIDIPVLILGVTA